MKDFLDNEIHIGDKVVYCRSRKNGFDMIKSEIIGFTEKMVKISPSFCSNKKYSVVSPYNCIVYEVNDEYLRLKACENCKSFGQCSNYIKSDSKILVRCINFGMLKNKLLNIKDN